VRRARNAGAHDLEKHVLDPDRGWQSVFGQDHAPRNNVRVASRFLKAETGVKEIVRTNNAVLLSVITSLLDGAKIQHMVLDQNMSILEGSVGIIPRRILVLDEQELQARHLLEDAGLGHELRPDGG
jgi:hypothetical protein